MSKSFTVTDVEVYTFVDVDIDEETLLEYGWVRAENQSPHVENWHNDTHTGPYVWCYQSPCYELNNS